MVIGDTSIKSAIVLISYSLLAILIANSIINLIRTKVIIKYL